MSLPSNTNEERNYNCMRKIVTDIVSRGLRTIFQQEWNNRYQATLGAWDNTATSGQMLFNMENKRPSARNYLDKYKKGNINEWDCTVLFDAILYSNSIGQARLNPSVKAEVDNLRKLRNEILHVPKGQLPEHDFVDASEKATKSFLALGLPTKEIDDIKMERKRVTSFQVLPQHPTHEVIRRENKVSTIIDDLKNLRTSNTGKLTYFYVSGNPGSGKSQLARQIGESNYREEMKKQTELTFVMTLNAKNPKSLLQSYDDFARRLNCTDTVVASIFNSNQTTEVKIRQLRTQITTRINNYKSWLIIVDNVEDLNLMSSLLPELGSEEWKGGQVLVTTQDSSHIPPNGSLTQHASISPGMTENESCRLLKTVSGTGEDPMLKEVAKVLDYQPLALAAAGVYLKQVQQSKAEFSWQNYLQKLDEGKIRLTQEQLRDTNPAYSHTMTTAVLLAVEKAAEAHLVLRHAFCFLSMASYESLPLEIVINYVLFAVKDQDREQVGVKIRNSSLILSDECETPSIRLHRVVHNGIKTYVKERKMDNTASSFDFAVGSFYQFKQRNEERNLVPHLKAFVAAMEKMFPNCKTLYPYNVRNEIWKSFTYFGSLLYHYGEFVTSKRFQTAALVICKEQDDPNPIQISASYECLGIIHKELGDLQQAKQYHERSRDIKLKQFGPNSAQIATSYNNLGNVHLFLGDLQQAKHYYELSRDIKLKQLGSNSVEVATSYNNLGNVHLSLGDLQQAKHNYELSRDIKLNQLGQNSAEVATSYNNLGNVHLSLGELQQAKHNYELSRDIKLKQLGPNSAQLATSYNNLGNVHDRLGDRQQAKEFHEQALNIRIKQLGPNNVHVAHSYDNLGNVHRHLGDLQQSKEYYECALDIKSKRLGQDHIDVALSYHNLGNVHKDLGDLQQAKQYHKRALDIRIKQLGHNHVNVAHSYHNLGNVHNDLRDLQQAKQCHEHSLKIRIKQLGLNHVHVAGTYNNLGNVHKKLGDLQQAKQCHERAKDIRIKQLGPNHVNVASSHNNLGIVHKDLGDLKQAKQYHERALHIRIKQLGPNHVHIATSYNNLGNVHLSLGDLQQAKHYYELSLDIKLKQLGPNSAEFAGTYDNMGIVHDRLGDLQQAKKYHEHALNVRIKQLGSNNVHVAHSYNNLGNVYRDLGELQQAKQYYERALDMKIKQLGQEHVDVATTYVNLGNVHKDLGDLQKAKQYYERALDINIKQLGEEHVDVATTYVKLGIVHKDLDDLQQAK